MSSSCHFFQCLLCLLHPKWQVHDHGGLCCMLLCRVTLGRARKLDSEFHVDKHQLQEAVFSMGSMGW